MKFCFIYIKGYVKKTRKLYILLNTDSKTYTNPKNNFQGLEDMLNNYEYIYTTTIEHLNDKQ